ncbi:hypothetical protein DI487_00600 [Flavobacterium sediminis]|uniref:Uncharacterized protein n=1 Tax=Flavobacterium sediminis TaxID=2201181 RepID=A0A2U8QRQ0_9FLAO|nr:hypothetical protein [Flavobacterium sediminis]AWM12515.1 hypothetical protein DI487_00600 [Flavobacterium sediminis]
MKKTLLFILSGISITVTAQVGVGTTTPRAALEVNSTTNGFLAPQIALTDTTIDTPVVNPAGGALTAGTIVYNTATVNDVTPGYYYWNGTIWVRMAAGTGGGSHNTLDMAYDEGGAGAGRVINADAGAVSITNNNSASTGLLVVNNTTSAGYSGQSNFVINDNTIGVVANVDANGVGVLIDHNDTNNPYAGLQITNYSANGSGILSTTNAAGPSIAVEADAASGAANAMTVYNFRTGGGAAIDAIGAIGIRSMSQTASGSAFAGYLNATQGTAAQFNGAGTASLSPINVFTGNNRYGAVVQGNPVGTYSSFPGTSGAAFIGYATNYSGAWFGYTLVTGGTLYDVYKSAPGKEEETKMMFNVVGPGINATTVKKDDKTYVMPAVSAPESLLQDYGTEKLVNGRATVTIDPILSENILVDKEHPLKVFIQLEGDCNGVYVTNKSAEGFEVVELGHGTSDVAFSYSIVASRATRAFSGKDGMEAFNAPERFRRIEVKPIAENLLSDDDKEIKPAIKLEDREELK